MLPNADGCGTGLQLSAKEVVLGRPDIFQSEIPRVSQSKIRSVVLNESVSTHGKRFASDLNNKENGAKATRLSAIVFFSELSSVSLSDHFPRDRFSVTISIVFSDETSDKFAHEIGLFPDSLETKPTDPRRFLSLSL